MTLGIGKSSSVLHLGDRLRDVTGGVEAVGRLPHELRLLAHLRDAPRVVRDRAFSTPRENGAAAAAAR